MADSIRTLAVQYFQLVDPPNLALPPGNVLVHPAVQQAIYEQMFDETLTPLPPVTYRTRVLKQIIARIEEAITDPEKDEILDSLMESWGNLVILPKPSALEQAQQLSSIKYTAPIQPQNSTSATNERTINILESRGLILSGGTTGNRTWEAALHLGSFLSTPTGMALIHDKRVIELGAGTGFLSLFCARHLGVKGVVATDRELFLIENMRACARLNRTDEDGDIPFYPAIWDWGTTLEKTEEMNSMTGGGKLEFDVALGADLIYDTDLVPLLISTVQDLFSNYGVSQFIIAATLRNENTFRTFLDACEGNAFKVEMLPFESTASEEQTGFFHSTSIPIHTYLISRA
ncbi:uncharacterized protein N7477_001420 [Penicillium maclennaniae]|uniref:uncharacterized protein n=1 Tax=Penicillium maclennaniae TaxID=1343394 RepID=UPI00253FC929|nr:uncharacterized protein N7477_001420 [Penicillium maclennaniae]KAJ5681480.1 hypothetical protein N7477_001420 [Penicillium maclennaniae]